MGRKIMTLSGFIGAPTSCPTDIDELQQESVQRLLTEADAKNAKSFEEEVEKLNRWSDDLKCSLEMEIKELDEEMTSTKKNAKLAPSLQEKIALQRQVRELEQKRNTKRKELYDSQDAIDQGLNKAIEDIEKRLKQTHKVQQVFNIRWMLE